jgi:hypothetical protein
MIFHYFADKFLEKIRYILTSRMKAQGYKAFQISNLKSEIFILP